MINSKRQQKRKRQRKCNNIDYYNNQEKQCEIENNNTFYKIVQNIAIKKSHPEKSPTFTGKKNSSYN